MVTTRYFLEIFLKSVALRFRARLDGWMELNTSEFIVEWALTEDFNKGEVKDKR